MFEHNSIWITSKCRSKEFSEKNSIKRAIPASTFCSIIWGRPSYWCIVFHISNNTSLNRQKTNKEGLTSSFEIHQEKLQVTLPSEWVSSFFDIANWDSGSCITNSNVLNLPNQSQHAPREGKSAKSVSKLLKQVKMSIGYPDPLDFEE